MRGRRGSGARASISGLRRALGVGLLCLLEVMSSCRSGSGSGGSGGEAAKREALGRCGDAADKPLARVPDPRAADDLWMVEVGRGSDSQSVRALLGHAVAGVRARAVLAAGRLAAPALRGPTLERLTDEAPEVRRAVAVAAALARWPGAEEPLLVRAAVDEAPEVRLAAVRALGVVGGTPAAEGLSALVRASSTPRALRVAGYDALARLARRGSTAVRPALRSALDLLAHGGAALGEQRSAARFVATVLDRQRSAASRLTAKDRHLLAKRSLLARDAMVRAALTRAAVRLGLHGLASLASLVSLGGGAGWVAAEALVKRDAARGVALSPLVARLVSEISRHACADQAPVMLWRMLRGLLSAPATPWLRHAAIEWLRGLAAARARAPAGGCVASQTARLECEAALLVDRLVGYPREVRTCGGAVIGAVDRQVLVVRALGRARGRGRIWRVLDARYRAGPLPVKVAALAAAARRGGAAAHRLLVQGLGSPQAALFGAAAEACGRKLARSDPGARCAARARQLLVALPRPPRDADLERWIELIKLARGYGDNAVVAALRAGAASFHPALRRVARRALARVLGRPPRARRWDGDRRPPPAPPPTQDVRIALDTPVGRLVVALHRKWAPVSVGHLVALVGKGALARSRFHRVVPGFVIQGGDPTGTGFGGDTGLRLSEWGEVAFRRGVVGLARAGKDTEGSQLFIMTGDAPHLDFAYTAVGEVVQGLELADRVLPGASLRVSLVGGGGAAARSPRGRPRSPGGARVPPFRAWARPPVSRDAPRRRGRGRPTDRRGSPRSAAAHRRAAPPRRRR